MLEYKGKKFFCINNISVMIFMLFLFVYLSFGLYLTYFSQTVTDLNYDIVYSIDSGATYWQLYLNDRIAAMKHPLIHILLNPIIFLLKGYIANPKLLSVILQSVLQSFVAVFIYKILFKLTNKKDISVLFTLIYGFSCTALLLTIFTEVYVFAAFGQVLFFSYFLHCYNNTDNKLSLTNKIVLIILSIIGYGINLINIVSCGVLILFLLCREYNKQWKNIIINVIKVAFTIAISVLILLQLQTFVFNIHDRTSGVGHVRLGYEKGKIINTIRGTYVEPLYALKSGATTELNEYEKQDGSKVYLPRYLTFDNQNIFRYFPAIFIFLFPLIFYIKNYKQYKNKSVINLLLILTGLYTLFNYSFYSFECALFALNYFPFLVILLGILYEKMSHNKIRNCLIILFLVFEIFINIFNLFKIHEFLLNYDTAVHSYIFSALITAISILFAGIIIYLLKKIATFQEFNFKFKNCYSLGLLIYAVIIAFYVIAGSIQRFIS